MITSPLAGLIRGEIVSSLMGKAAMAKAMTHERRGEGSTLRQAASLEETSRRVESATGAGDGSPLGEAALDSSEILKLEVELSNNLNYLSISNEKMNMNSDH